LLYVTKQNLNKKNPQTLEEKRFSSSCFLGVLKNKMFKLHKNDYFFLCTRLHYFLHQHNTFSFAWCGPITYWKQLENKQDLKHPILSKSAIVLR
jgi:hypothetical protein